MRANRILLYAVCLFAGHLEVFAQQAAGRPGAFMRIGVGARALALGGAFSAVADDPSAVYWNPAGMAQIRSLGLVASYHRMTQDRAFYFASAAVPVGRAATLGVSWIGWNVSGIEGRSSNTAEPDFTFTNNEHALVGTYSYHLSSSLYVGASAKVIFQNLYTASATGFGLDLAALVQPMENLRVGVGLHDLTTRTKWSTGLRESFPTTVRLGASFNISTSMLFAVDLYKMNGEKIGFSWGAEYTALSLLPIRLGYTEHGTVGGAGLAIPMRSMLMHFDYAYARDPLDGGRSHKITLGLSLSKKTSHLETSELMSHGAKIESVAPPARKNEPEVAVAQQIFLEARRAAVPVRLGPGDNYKRIAIDINKGRQFKRFASAGGWYKIELMAGKFGWIHKKDVKEVLK